MEAIYFDLDGTLADLYNAPAWLENLRNENVAPYRDAAPLCDVEELTHLIERFKMLGVVVGVVSWGSMGGSREYTRAVKKVKRVWCERHGLSFSEFHVVKYGTPKHHVVNVKSNAVLVDDNSDVRNAWNIGGTIDATLGVVEELRRLLETLDPGTGEA